MVLLVILVTERQVIADLHILNKETVFVCCSRAKKNLAVFYPAPTAEIVENAKRLLAEQNVIDLDSYNDGKDG